MRGKVNYMYRNVEEQELTNSSSRGRCSSKVYQQLKVRSNLPLYLFNKINVVRGMGTCALVVVFYKRHLHENNKKKASHSKYPQKKGTLMIAQAVMIATENKKTLFFFKTSLSNSNVFSPITINYRCRLIKVHFYMPMIL